jgi:hypothetical protein
MTISTFLATNHIDLANFDYMILCIYMSVLTIMIRTHPRHIHKIDLFPVKTLYNICHSILDLLILSVRPIHFSESQKPLLTIQLINWLRIYLNNTVHAFLIIASLPPDTKLFSAWSHLRKQECYIGTVHI